MANICWFEMRIRGTKKNCYAMLNSGISCYDMHIKAERGTESDYMMYIGGECRWSVTTSMVEVENGDTLAAKAAKFQLELEVCGLDESRESHERFHYIGDKVIKENNLPESLPAWGDESGDFGLSEEAVQKYDKNEEQDMYVLREEFVEHFTFDYELDEAVFDFSMSFRDLPRFEVQEVSVKEDVTDDVKRDLLSKTDADCIIAENANVHSESAATAESTMTCPHCNRTINSKDTFCIYCGKVIVTQNNIGDESIESLINRRAETLERINAANAEMLELEQKEQQLLAQTEDLAHQEANLQHAEEKLSRKRNELQQAQTAYRREAEEIGFHAE